MTDPDEVLFAIMVARTATAEEANDLAEHSRGCPYVGAYVADGCLATGLFALPACKRWWIEYPQEHPELLGAEEVAVFFGERVLASSAWSRGEVQPVLEMAPCNTDCIKCPQYRARCSGCPATVHYLDKSLP